VLAASSQLIREVISSVKDQESLYGYDLANEIDNFVKLDSREEAIKWVEFVVQEIKVIDNTHPITMGLHLNNIEEERGFWPEDLTSVCDFLSMHSYSLYAKWADDYLDGKVAGFTNRLIAKMSGARVMHTEFGICTIKGKTEKAAVGEYPFVEEKAAQTYLANSLKGLYENGALGALFWCYSDYHPSIFSQPPFEHSIHERSFGLFRDDGSLKPYKNIIEKYQNLEVKQIVQPKDIDNAIYYKQPLVYLKEEYKKFS
ncbi:MAG: hypothetical protein KAS87_00705, partial [Candidatus Omnitrophica bacterium]|nr:hypothetical protein [Candidatus Omnitrophota bacterium]